MGYYRAAVTVRNERSLGENNEGVTEGSVVEVSDARWEMRRIYRQKTVGLG